MGQGGQDEDPAAACGDRVQKRARKSMRSPTAGSGVGMAWGPRLLQLWGHLPGCHTRLHLQEGHGAGSGLPTCWQWKRWVHISNDTLGFLFAFQTAVDVFRRIILEAEKIDGAASQGKSSCSVM